MSSRGAVVPRFPPERNTLSEMARALTALRVTRGWSQQDLARTCGIHSSAVSTYERGKKVPQMETLTRLLAGLCYTLEDLDAALAFVRGRDRAEQVPTGGELDPEAHRVAAKMAGAAYDVCYALLTRREGSVSRNDVPPGDAANLVPP
jgi:transcriptional regulator with XRE-family HTH domain